jgi:hypothetical protein
MSTDAAPIFDAALALPQALRADLAAKLIESLDEELSPASNRTPQEWIQIINDRCDAVDRGEEEIMDGEHAMAMLREIVDRAKPSS